TQPRMGDVFRIEIPIESKQGRKLTVGIETELRRDVNGRVLSLRGLMRDVSEAVRAEQEIARLSSVDPVTGLPNRDRFIEVCTESIAGSRASGMQTAVIVMDMDRFGQINESLGPAA